MNVIDEFQDQLDAWADLYADRPRAHLRALWHVGLEREQLVTVAYDPRVISARLERMGVDDDIAHCVTRAIGWAWRDEEMHALYIRGTLLHESALPERLRTWLTHASGQIAGWTSSRQHHYRWREAPVTRAVAELVELAGALGGQVPEGAREHLHFDTFRGFCRFSIAAETTAAMGWSAMADIGQAAGIDARDISAFRKMEQDERRHAAIFSILANAFDDDDHLRSDVTLDSLTRAISAVGQRFLATPSEGAAAWDNPLGKGAPVVVHAAPAGHDADAVMTAVLDRVSLTALIDDHRPAEGPFRVAIRATFMHAYSRHDASPHIHPALLESLARTLAEHGAEVTVLENGNLYDQFHRGREVLSVARYLGLGSPHYTVADVSTQLVVHPYIRGQGREHIARSWRDAHLRIVFGKLRSHPVTGAMLTLEGAEGLCGRHDDTLWGTRKTDRTTASLMVLDAFPPHLALLDAWRDVPDGLLGMMGSADPLQPLRLYASTDAVSLDCVAARHTAHPDLSRHRFIETALDWFGDPRPALRVVGEDTPIDGWRAPDRGAADRLLAHLAEPMFVHASGQGAVFVPPMDPVAFPERTPPSPALRLARRAVMRLIGHDFPEPAAPELLPTALLSIRGRTVRTSILGEGPPIVLLHGYPDTLHVAARLARALATDHRVFLFDWPGTGGSDAWPGDLTPDALADRLVHLLDAWDVPSAHLFGIDMGGPPALCAAARHPDRVTRVTVANSLLYADAPTSPEIAVMRRAGLSTLAFLTSPRAMYAQCKRTFLPPGWALPDALDDDVWSAFSQAPVRRTLARMCRHYERALPALPARYDAVTCPVTAVWGSDEHHFDVAHGQRLVQGHANRELVVIPDAPHWMHWTHPERLAAIVRGS